MKYPRYFVTLITTDESIGSNPGHHSGFILSVQESENAPLKSLGAYGYYGVPSSQRSGLLFLLKRQTGLDVDLVGNHGWLKSEELCFLDRGHGVMGATKGLSQNQFLALQNEVQARLAGQAASVEEWKAEQITKERPVKTKAFPRLYSEEQYSEEIYRGEKAKNADKCRLKEFEFGKGVTCHYQALSLLKAYVEDDAWIAKLGYKKTIKQSIPRTIESAMAPVYLRGSGAFKPFQDGVSGLHRKGVRSDNRVYHCEQDVGTEVIWALPPQELLIEQKCAPEQIAGAQQAVSKLLGLYWLFADYDKAIIIENNAVLEGDSAYRQLRQYLSSVLGLFSVSMLEKGLKQTNRLLEDLRRAFLSDSELAIIRLENQTLQANILHSLPDRAKSRFVALCDLRSDLQVEGTCTAEYAKIAALESATQGLNRDALSALQETYLNDVPVVMDADSSDDELYFSSEEYETSSEDEALEQKDRFAWNICAERDGVIDSIKKLIMFKTQTSEADFFSSRDTLAFFARGKVPSWSTSKILEHADRLIAGAKSIQSAMDKYEENNVAPTT